MLFIIAFLVFLTILIRYESFISIAMHNRMAPTWLANITNHPLAVPYSESIFMEERYRDNKITDMGGFPRVADLITIDALKVEIDESIINELDNLHSCTPGKRLGDPLVVKGSKKSWYLLVFGKETVHAKKVPNIMNIVTTIAKSQSAIPVGACIGTMKPFTWLKFHEGFWGYAQYITRCLVVLDGPSYGCGVHVAGQAPISTPPGVVVSFDDCDMHEAWNITPDERATLIVDLMIPQDGFPDFTQGVKSINRIVKTVKRNKDPQNEARAQLSIETAKVARGELKNN